jgi:ribosome-binding factor A
MTQRTDRIDELLRQEIGDILARDVQDPRIGFVTITDVETAPDLSTARVWVSVIGQPAERDETIRALSRAMPFVRHELGSRVRLRRIPELHVRLDDTAQRGTRVLRLLAELEAGATPDEPGAIAESLPTPVPRLPHEDDAPAEPGAEPAAGSGGPRSRGRADRGRDGFGRSGSGAARGRGSGPRRSGGGGADRGRSGPGRPGKRGAR